MKLIGMFDSPFVRRVGIALRLYGMPFEHLPYSVFRDGELIAPYNPLRRVPALVLDDGSVLVETFVCLDYLDEWVDGQADVAARPLLLPRGGTQRQRGLRLCALASGTADKAVSLAYEREVRETRSARWIERCTLQIRNTLQFLDAECSKGEGTYLLGAQLSHADIAISTALTFVSDAHPGFLLAGSLPNLRAHVARCEALPEFSSVYQAFEIPPG